MQKTFILLHIRAMNFRSKFVEISDHVSKLIFYYIENFILLHYESLTESRFESPISISKLNNYSDFGRKSENYFNVKIFSDSRPKSAQNLILKVFSDLRTQLICRLSEFLKTKIRRYTWLKSGSTVR